MERQLSTRRIRRTRASTAAFPAFGESARRILWMIRIRRAPAPETVLESTERLRAVDPSDSFIVQAPAGSGKTELLIQRFLTLLSLVEQPESIIAITFTKKAAGEMRHRVIGALQKAAAESAPEEAHERQTWELSRRALARDQELTWQLIQHPSRLRIQTIDSFCSSLVRQMPWVSRMGASPQP